MTGTRTVAHHSPDSRWEVRVNVSPSIPIMTARGVATSVRRTRAVLAAVARTLARTGTSRRECRRLSVAGLLAPIPFLFRLGSIMPTSELMGQVESSGYRA